MLCPISGRVSPVISAISRASSLTWPATSSFDPFLEGCLSSAKPRPAVGIIFNKAGFRGATIGRGRMVSDLLTPWKFNRGGMVVSVVVKSNAILSPHLISTRVDALAKISV